MRQIPKSRATITPGVSGDKVAIPAGTAFIKLKGSGAVYYGVGNSGTVPAASADNSVYLDAAVNETFSVGDISPNRYVYLYVWSQTATSTCLISFYGGA